MVVVVEAALKSSIGLDSKVEKKGRRGVGKGRVCVCVFWYLKSGSE